MRKLNKLSIITIVVFLAFVVSCGKSYKTQMTMTTDKVDSIKIGLSGSWGTVAIDWGNGTAIKSRGLWSLPTYFVQNYSDASSHTITISGRRLITIKGLDSFDNQLTSLDIGKNTNLQSLQIIRNQLTSLDVSKNIELTLLNCTSNRLTSLDVSNNIALENLSCENNLLTSLDVSNNPNLMSLFLRSNQLSATALNALFETLHNNKTWDYQTIYIGGNPGAENSNHSIAIDKGWQVNTEMVDF